MMELNKNNIEDILPLTPLQAGMLYHDLLEKENNHHISYNQQVHFRLTGHLNIDAFRRAWQCLIDRHAALRVIFKHDKSVEPIQIVLKKRDFMVQFVDLSSLIYEERNQQLEAFIESDKCQNFELEREIPLRVALLKVAPEVHYFVWSFHHICLDGWCVASLQQELFTVYQQLDAGQCIDLPPAPSFSRYIQWHKNQWDKNQAAHQDFWRSYLDGYGVTISPPLPTLQYYNEHHEDISSDSVQFEKQPSSDKEYCREVRSIEEACFEQLHQLSTSTRATLSTLFHCLWGIFLAKTNETNDVVFGSVQSIRPLAHSQFDQLIGLCINTMPYRIQFNDQDSFAEIAQKSQLAQLNCIEHATMSLSEIQSQCSQVSPLFDHFIAFENYPSSDHDVEDKEQLATALYADEFHEYMPTSYPFHLAVLPTKKSLQVLFKYIPKKVESDNVRAIADSFSQFVRTCLLNTETAISQIPLVESTAAAEMYHLDAVPEQLQSASHLTAFYLQQTTSQQSPVDHVALVEGDKQLTHRQLAHASLKLAHLIKDKLQGETVAIYDGPGIGMVVAMFACFRLGIPYVPLDPSNPLAVSKAILNKAHVGLLVSSRQDVQQQAEVLTTEIECLTVDESLMVSLRDDSPLPASPHLDSTAYIIFTSGTTGEPKGVPITHRALINYVSWCRDKFGFSDHSSSLLLTSFFFDLGYTSIFGTLLLGGTLHIAHESQRRDPEWVATYIKAQRISFLKLTPSYLHMLIEVLGDQRFAGCDLQQVLLGGEPLNYRDIRNIRQRHPDLCLFNHYGPSENTIGSCAHQITDRDIVSQHQNIGRPAHNVEAFILDRNCAVCPPYVEGDLYLAGSQLMASYLNPQNNENRLVQWTNPQWANKNQPIYRSGDRAYRTVDGDIIFKGREQQSVKIDGYRVDLSAVQQVIHGYSGVKDCLVDSFKRRDETVIIVALLIPAAANRIDVDALRSWLGEQLPHYMHPSDFIEVSRFPMTENGKLDRKELVNYWQNRLNLSLEQVYQAPKTETETKLLAIWQRLFLKERISTSTSFFTLGGHSIKAIICTSEIRKTFKVDLPVSLVFTYPTIVELAKAIDRYHPVPLHQPDTPYLAEMSVAESCQRILPLYNTHKQTGEIVYCLPPVIGTSTVYKELFESLQMPLRIFGFQCGGFVNALLQESMEKLADLVTRSIVTHSQPLKTRKMILFGYSFGAVLALEVAKRLESKGYEIALLLLDSNLNAECIRTDLTFNEMRHISYWNKIISIFEQHLNHTELRRIENGVIHNQRLLHHYLLAQDMSVQLLNSDMICIESSGNAGQGYMQSFGHKTSGGCQLLTTPGDHYSMFQPPHFSVLLSKIRDAIELLSQSTHANVELT